MAKSKQQDPFFVGHDDGHYCQKLAIQPGALTHCPQTGQALPLDQAFQFSMPSRVAVGSIVGGAVVETDDDNIYEVTYISNGKEVVERYTVIGNETSSLPVLDTRSNEFPLSGGLVALIHHSLYKAGMGGRDVHIGTGLPYNRFYLPGGVKNMDLINRKRDHLLNAKVRNLNPSVVLANIVEHTVVSEGVAGHLDLLYLDNGDVNEQYCDSLEAAPVGFVDIGGNTTDVVVIKTGGADIDAHRSFTIDAGGLHVEQEIENGLRTELKMQADFVLPRKMMELLAQTGKVRLRGQVHDLNDSLVIPAKRNQAVRIMNEFRAKLKGGFDLDCIYLIGGGSLLLADEMKNLIGDDTMISNVEYGEFANARGMMKKIMYADRAE